MLPLLALKTRSFELLCVNEEEKMKLFGKIAFISFVLTSSIALAYTETTRNSAAVNKSTCNTMVNATQPFILVLNKNDDLIESITQCAKDAKLMGATVSGLGQVHNPALAYFTSDPKAKPAVTTFHGFYELASLNGNITNNSDKYYTHLHAVLADNKFHGIAGHVNSAKVGITAEITIKPLSSPLQRTVDSHTGFGPIVS